jgi:hypothetical protein
MNKVTIICERMKCECMEKDKLLREMCGSGWVRGYNTGDVVREARLKSIRARHTSKPKRAGHLINI